MNLTAGNAARETTEVQIGAIDPLHRHAKRQLLLASFINLYGFQVAHQRRAVVPGHVLALFSDVFTAQGRHGDGRNVLQVDLLGELAVVGNDVVEDFFRVAHQVHLVDCQHDLANANQRSQIAVAPRLRQHTSAGIDHDHGHIGRRCAGDHVAGVLFVAGRIGHDELALVCREKAVGHINGDALLTLCGQAVHQQGKVQLAPLRADFFGVCDQGFHLVFKQHLGFVQQATDQGTFAIIHAAAGDEAQQAFLFMDLEIFLDIFGNEIRYMCHQKYPSCFFFSMDAAESWSIIRPCLSEVRVSSIS